MALTHLDRKGRVSMVDVGEKTVTRRAARAKGIIRMSTDAFAAVMSDSVKKGNVLATAKIAGIMAAKNTGTTIPLCHPLPIEHISVDFHPDESSSSIGAEATVKVSGRTGVEMEALHAVTVALLTIYDMVKAVDKSMTIGEIRLEEKSGGRSGHYKRK
ncbi:MAG TPA: cyclic pyranopterin monophosphate synthase MoaC [Deltaproteobacteria bacterium]|nr:cyclic pyranopterin monophosphate synthase MoaC [Deltaproteobacteria bacterium]HPR53594.1 cyclic pyranopterin monophosphate synthase MoaC [Deltaproteobacteria bacterium]HXK47109.1 cyclic pyranopterin monophosphate synthase MoaC [Deltaproteobacteria bacterium]